MLTRREKVARLIRIASVPPIMITGLILILYRFKNEYFNNPSDAVIAICLLGFVPVLAYPISRFIPVISEKGREVQRKVAFVTNLIGYTVAFVWACIENVGIELWILCATYFFSVVLLTICNICLTKASGHASSFTGPVLMLIYSFGLMVSIPGIAVAAAIWWSSVELKRHTAKQLLAGTVICSLSFGIALTIAYFFMFP